MILSTCRSVSSDYTGADMLEDCRALSEQMEDMSIKVLFSSWVKSF